MQNVPFNPRIVDLHTLVGKVAPCAHADKEVAFTLVDYMSGVITEHLATSLEEVLPYLFEGVRRGIVGEVERIDSPVRRREEVEARIGKCEIELIVLNIGSAVCPGHDVRVSDASPAPVPSFHTIQNDGSAVPAHAETVLVLGQHRRIPQVDVLTETRCDRRIA